MKEAAAAALQRKLLEESAAEIKALKIKSEMQINAITHNYEQRLDKLRQAIGKRHRH